jgi:lipid-binding SYLF domain-containing protein
MFNSSQITHVIQTNKIGEVNTDKDATMKITHRHNLIVVALVCALAVVAHAADNKKETKQKEIRKMAQDTLHRLYKADPKTKAAVEGAAGYAVFSNLGVKILVAGSGNGQGIAVNNKSKNETFMKMLELQAGLGMGVKKFRVVFVFDDEKAFNSFVNSGWQFGGQSTAAAKAGDKGGAMAGAVSVSDGVWMYQLTDKGLALEITAKSTKYYKDDYLN